MGRGLTVPNAGRKWRSACINMIPVKKEQEKHTHRGRVTSLTTVMILVLDTYLKTN